MISTLLLFTHLLAHAEDYKGNYIDKLKKEIAEDADEDEPKAQNFTERRKKELIQEDEEDEKPQNPSEEYTQKQKESLQGNDEDDSEKNSAQYTDEQKKAIGAEEAQLDPEDQLPASPIEAVKSGQSELKLKRPGQIHHAFTLRVGAVLNVSAVAKGDFASGRDYTLVYGNGYHPNLTFFYEYQPFHSEWLGSLGILGGAGFSIQSGKGQFSSTLINSVTGEEFPAKAKTSFKFITMPVYLGLTYRFNLPWIIRPYVSGGGVLVGFMESRNDDRENIIGNSRGFFVSGGVSILLDWISGHSSWQLYKTGGVKHYYLTVEYSRMDTFSGPVEFNNSGVFTGLTFEF